MAGRRRANKRKKKTGLMNKVAGCNKQKNITVRDIQMNCRSLKHKLKSLATNFTENKNSFILTNETWFKSRDPQLKSYLLNLEDKYDISCIRKDRKASKSGAAYRGLPSFTIRPYAVLKSLHLMRSVAKNKGTMRS